jgi:NAD(P) transhydrogenase
MPSVLKYAEAAAEPLIGEVPECELEQDYDLVVIGGGPVGVASALKASTLGRRCLVIDKPKLRPNSEGLDISFGGPTGLFSKALREAGKTVDVNSLKSMGLYDNVIWSQVRGMCEHLASMNAEHQVKLMKDFKIGYLQGSATVVSPGKILVYKDDGRHWIITTEKLLLATGSKPTRPANIPFDDVRVFDSDSVNTLAFLPKEVVISGGGIISIEYAKIFRKLGAQVSLIVRSGAKSSLERIGLDPDIADQLIYFLKKDNIQIYENTEISNYDVPEDTSEKIRLTTKSKDAGVPAEVTCDIFLAAIGRRPNVTNLGLEKLGLKISARGGHIEVDGYFRTSVPSIYAAGDVIGPPSLASTGVHQGQCAVVSMFDEGCAKCGTSFPIGMWTVPECAYFGLTKAAAEKEGLDVEEGQAPYNACLRGRVFAPDGLLKLVFQKDDGVIVGVHMIGADACELVHYGMDLVEQKVTIFTLIATLFTAVTYHELFKEAALNGNSKLAFGAQWQNILSELGMVGMDDSGAEMDEEKMKREFESMDTSGDGSLDADELHAVFQKLGKDVKKGTIANLVRLADDDGNGTIEWEEFSKIFQVVRECQRKSNARMTPRPSLSNIDASATLGVEPKAGGGVAAAQGVSEPKIAAKTEAKTQTEEHFVITETATTIEMEAPTMIHERVEPEAYCPTGHRLYDLLSTREVYFCDRCGKALPEGARRYGCHKCDYDECFACYAARTCEVVKTHGVEPIEPIILSTALGA